MAEDEEAAASEASERESRECEEHLAALRPTPHNPSCGHPLMTRDLTEDLLRPLTRRTVKTENSLSLIWPLSLRGTREEEDRLGGMA